jgi:hypothetical protein
MATMNPDDCISDKTLGQDRPNTQGPYYFQKKRYWNQADFCSLLGVEERHKWWTIFRKGKIYQQINGTDLPSNCPLYQFIDIMRKDDWGWNLAGDIFDKKSTVLILIGNTKRSPSQTKFHLDWSRAKNWAIQLHVS